VKREILDEAQQDDRYLLIQEPGFSFLTQRSPDFPLKLIDAGTHIALSTFLLAVSWVAWLYFAYG